MSVVKSRSELDSSGFNRGLSGMDKGVSSLASRISKVGGMIAGAFAGGVAINALKQFGQELANIKDRADQLNISTKELQTFEFKAATTGSSPEQFFNAMAKLEQVQQDAIQGNETAIKSFERLGISVGQVASMTKQELFEAVARGANGTGTFADALDVLGSRAKTLRPLLEEIATVGIRGMAEEMEKAGLIISDQSIQMADKFDDTVLKWKQQLKVFGAETIDAAENITAALSNMWASAGMGRQISLTESMQEIIRAKNQEEKAGEKKRKEGEDAAMQQRVTAAQSRIAALRERIGEVGISDAQKIAKLEEKKSEFVLDEAGATSELERLAAVENILKIEEQIAALRQGEENPAMEQRVRVGAPISDSLARIGGELGGAANNRGLALAERQYQLTLQSTRHQERTANGVEKLASEGMGSL